MDIDTTTPLGRRIATELDTEQVAWLTTVTPRGTPQPSPVWFLWSSGEILVLSQPDKPKLRNITANPQVALHFNSDPAGNRVSILHGVARVDEGTLGDDELTAYRAKYDAAIGRLGYTAEQFLGEYSVPLRIVPQRMRGF